MNLSTVAIFLLGIPSAGSLSQEVQTGYPTFPKTDVILTVSEGRGFLSSKAASAYSVTFASSESADGPWEYSSEIIDLIGARRFFRAVVNPGFVRFEGQFVR